MTKKLTIFIIALLIASSVFAEVNFMVCVPVFPSDTYVYDGNIVECGYHHFPSLPPNSRHFHAPRPIPPPTPFPPISTKTYSSISIRSIKDLS